MIKTSMALAVMLAVCAAAPATAATHHKHGKAAAHAAHATGAHGKTTSHGATHTAAHGKTRHATHGGKGAAHAAVPVAAAVATPHPKAVAAPVRRQDKSFDVLSNQFLSALWREDPESAIEVGKYDTAANLTIPNQAHQIEQLAFIDDWLARFGKVDARQLSAKQRTDLALLVNKLKSDRFDATTLREFEWNPASYNIAESIDLILNTEYAAKPQRLRTLLKRIAGVPAYYEAARNNIVKPTREHTQLAITQAPGVQSILTELDKQAQASILNPAEKQLFTQRINAALTAVDGYVAWLSELDKTMAQEGGGRSFRIGKELYEQKFAYDIQSASTAEQTYQKALAAREDLLQHMEQLSDELWPKVMGDAAKPADRTAKIGLVIDKLSANHVAREDFVNEIRREIPALQDWVISHNLLTMDPKKQLEVRATPAYQAGVAGASVNAPGPYRPQDKTWYNVTPLDNETPEQAQSSLREYNHWILQILNIHEAIPGHYAQLVYANRSPSLVKSLFGNGAMVEGWAVYGERMMLDAGYGDNAPEMALMYAKWHLRVISNTILDYGVHVLGMQEAEAMDLLERQAFQTHTEAAEKWQRVQLSSVQLTSYFSGYTEIMELREQRKQQLGAKFVLKDFNEQFLSYGNAPVRMIKDLMH
ncbi:DUF885 domain-containing protein [Rugamonas sp.]|uniref:DUF885 domain-containing protein n=1 Tax=Rugamonas sp. TaxID=1926287 RepID=UPI0025DBC58C|nr:DUF885 domain-containing protein [Rugamonas sp.]